MGQKASAMASGSASKPKEVVALREKKNILYDMVKSDGQFKEMITMQELARNAYDTRWGFMGKKHILKIYEEIATGMSLSPNFMINHRRKKIFEREYNNKLVDSPPFPTLSSGMVGWRSSNSQCSLEVVGPMYVSPTMTIDPPRRESDLPEHQTNIHLG